MVTKMLVKEIEKHEVHSIILNSYVMLFCVLLEFGGGYAETPNAFIFSLNNSERLAPFLSKPKDTKRAIDRRSDTGPKFGLDIIIYLDASSITRSTAGLVKYYSVPASVKDKGRTVLAGTVYFSPDEVEVFYLGPSR